MAAELKPINKNKASVDTKKYYVNYDNDGWDRSEIQLKASKGNITLFGFDGPASPMSCCGIQECSDFKFGGKPDYSKELQEAFNEMVSSPLVDNACGHKPAIRLFVLNRSKGAVNAKQPAWFVQCLDNYPGATCLDWVHNTNTRNTDIKMYMLPVHRNA